MFPTHLFSECTSAQQTGIHIHNTCTHAHTPHMIAIPALREEDENEGEETKTDPNAGKLQGNREPHKAWASGSACTRCLVPRCSLLRGPALQFKAFQRKSELKVVEPYFEKGTRDSVFSFSHSIPRLGTQKGWRTPPRDCILTAS